MVVAEQVLQPVVGVEQHATFGHRRRSFPHFLDDDPVRPVGAGQRVQTLVVGVTDHDRVDTAAADRGERRTEILELAA